MHFWHDGVKLIFVLDMSLNERNMKINPTDVIVKCINELIYISRVVVLETICVYFQKCKQFYFQIAHK